MTPPGDHRLLGAGLRRTAAAAPGALAIVDGDVRLDYAELRDRVARAVTVLADLGIGPGATVAWQLPNWWEALVIHHAVTALGAVSNPLMPILRERELTFMLAQSGARVLIVPETFRGFDFAGMAEALRTATGSLDHVLVTRSTRARGNDLGARLAAAPPADLSVDPARAPGDAALLLYTSGTESVPKGALHSHLTLAHEVASIRDLYALDGADVVFMPSPVAHITGVLYGMHLPVPLGSAVVLQDIWDPAAALRLIERERCSFQVGATPFLQGLARHPDLVERDVTSLRVFACGGADVSPALVREATSRLGCCVVRTYGSTEMPTVTAGRPADPIALRAATDGQVIGAAQVRVVDDAGDPVAAGEAGELQARGPELFLGYLDERLDAAAMTPDGWFRTGDLGVLDPDGYLTISGRAKDIIIRGGENISAKEVEDLLLEHDAVGEVAVVAMPDEAMGEKACAFVVCAPGAEPPALDDLVAFLADRRIARQKLPQRLEVRDALPRTASGKIQKYELRRQVAELVGREIVR